MFKTKSHELAAFCTWLSVVINCDSPCPLEGIPATDRRTITKKSGNLQEDNGLVTQNQLSYITRLQILPRNQQAGDSSHSVLSWRSGGALSSLT